MSHITPIAFPESIRKRPKMYIGNNGVPALISGVITDCIGLSDNIQIRFEFTIFQENDFRLLIVSDHPLNSLMQQFNAEPKFEYLYIAALNVLSSKHDLQSKSETEISVCFSIDQTVLPDVSLDYIALFEKLLLIALLNRQIEILIRDERLKYPNQNYLHFPEGIAYLFDQQVKKALGTPKFKINYDGTAADHQLQLAIAYRTDWYNQPEITSFANHQQTTYHGSHVDGVLNGLVSALKTFAKEQNLDAGKVVRKKLFNGLILVCAIKGQAIQYGGSFKDLVADKNIETLVSRLTKSLVLDFLHENPEIAKDFMQRFIGPMNAMY